MPRGDELLGYAGILMGGARDELRPSRTGSLFLAYDLKRYKAEARAQVIQQSLYWAGWVTALALAMWLAFHFLLTRRTARLVRAAEQTRRRQPRKHAAISRARDELGRSESRVRRHGARRLRRISRARERADEALRVSEASYRAIFDASEDAIFVHDLATARSSTSIPKRWRHIRLQPRRGRSCTSTSDAWDRRRPYTPAGCDRPDRARRRRRADSRRVARDAQGRRCAEIEVFMPSRCTIGGIRPILTIARDITEKKRSAEELARQRESLLPARKARRAGIAARRRRARAQQSALGRGGAGGDARGAGRPRHAGRGDEDPRRCGTLRTHRAHLPRHGPPAAARARPVAINDVIAAALDITAYAVRTSSIEVDARPRQRLPLILADADQLHQVLLNLVINAQHVAAGSSRTALHPPDQPSRPRPRRGAHQRRRQRARHSGASARARVRALLHHQADRRRHRGRAGGEPRHRGSPRRYAHGRLPARRRRCLPHHVAGRGGRPRRKPIPDRKARRARNAAGSSSSTTRRRSAKR